MTTTLPTTARTEPTGHPDDKWGWAVQLALSIKNIPTGAGDVINISGVYTDGATRYNFQNLAGSTLLRCSAAPASPTRALASPSAPDTVFITGSPQETVEDLGLPWCLHPQLGSLLEHRDLRCLRSGAVRFAGQDHALRRRWCWRRSVGLAGVTGCNPDFAIGQVGIITRWTPVKNLTFSADLTWTHLDQKYAGTGDHAGVRHRLAKPAAIYELKDQDTRSPCSSALSATGKFGLTT